MNKKLIRTIHTLILSILFCASAQATTYNYVSSPTLSGNMAGPDLLWDTADDFSSLPGPGGSTLTGFNPNGNASGFLFSGITLFGSIGGSFEVDGTTVTNYNGQGELNDLTDPNNPIIGTPITESLTANTTSTFVVNSDNTANSNFFLDVTDGVNPANSFNLFAEYAYFNNGEDYNTIFSGAANEVLRQQIDFVFPFLPTNWETFFIGIERFDFFGLTDDFGNPIQLGGYQAVAFYSTVPEPATLALMGLGMAGLGLTRRKRLH